jgi:bis(5'-nucleosidyl)-tetraphosphatase
MQTEISCGAIIWRRKGDNFEFLVVRRSDNSIWETPKGHMNKNESEEDASKRELEEELGFVDMIFESGFREVLEYVSSRGVKRQFVLFLCHSQKIKLSKEHDKYEWVTTENLKIFFDYDDIIRIYKSAEKFLKNKKLLSLS